MLSSKNKLPTIRAWMLSKKDSPRPDIAYALTVFKPNLYPNYTVVCRGMFTASLRLDQFEEDDILLMIADAVDNNSVLEFVFDWEDNSWDLRVSETEKCYWKETDVGYFGDITQPKALKPDATAAKKKFRLSS